MIYERMKTEYDTLLNGTIAMGTKELIFQNPIVHLPSSSPEKNISPFYLKI